MRRAPVISFSAFVSLFALSGPAQCQAQPSSANQRQPPAAAALQQESQADELSRRATDPTNSPPNVSLINDVTFAYRDRADGSSVDETGYDLRFQPVVPFRAWGHANILRATVPYQISGPDSGGLRDVSIFDIVLVPQSWGRLAIGGVGSFAPATSDVSAHAVGGPAIGFAAPVRRKLLLGLFNQNLFGNDVATSQFQPIAAYQLGNGWALSLGDLQWVYSWEDDEFLSMPLGFQLGKVLRLAGQPMRFSVNPQYDLKDAPGSSRFNVIFTVVLLLPEGK